MSTLKVLNIKMIVMFHINIFDYPVSFLIYRLRSSEWLAVFIREIHFLTMFAVFVLLCFFPEIMAHLRLIVEMSSVVSTLTTPVNVSGLTAVVYTLCLRQSGENFTVVMSFLKLTIAGVITCFIIFNNIINLVILAKMTSINSRVKVGILMSCILMFLISGMFHVVISQNNHGILVFCTIEFIIDPTSTDVCWQKEQQ